MRFHTDKLEYGELVSAARLAGAYLDTAERHNSKSRDHAFEIHLRGNSRRRPNFYNGDGQYAATWDQWGVFMGKLFSLDPEMQINSGRSAETDAQFHWRTDGRFDLEYTIVPTEIPFPLNHDHNFKFDGIIYTNRCVGKNGCGAIQRRDW